MNHFEKASREMLESASACKSLRSAGLRLTPQRRAVIDVLVGDTSHPTVDVVAARVSQHTKGVSLSTVYKVLHELSDLGLIREIDLAGVMHFDPNPVDHVHVVCSECGDIIDAEVEPGTRDSLAASLSSVLSSVAQLDIVVRGQCHVCAGK